VPDLRRHIVALTLDNDIDATVTEKTDIGHAILQEMRRSSKVRPILQEVRCDKEARFLAQTPKFEAGRILFPREAPWLAELVRELVEFPNGAHDDQVDSISQALKYLSRKIPTPRDVERQAVRVARRERF
jgi:predicted phage terminase large subunit-like protein